MLKQMFVVAALFASACIDDGVGGDPGSLPTDESPVDPSPEASEAVARQRQPDPESNPVCALLPQDDSACAHACDPDALLGYIPAGTCATIRCTLVDGSTYVTGGCN